MRKPFSTCGKYATRALYVMAACGLSWSCTDDFKLDDEKPSWLNSSIYESLEQRGNFKTYLRLLGDKDVNPESARPLTEVLGRTGSKTVFVANDEAWEAFFKKNATLPVTNPWHNATSYERLSEAQKKLLIHTSMLNNAIVMENLASSDGSGSNTPTRGEYMRRFTDYMLTDSITFLPGDAVPYTYNEGEMNYWRRFRTEAGGKGIYLVEDSTRNMMIHFTAEHMAKQGVTDNDFAIVMGRERQTGDVHIYDALLMEKDGVAENGYVNVTEKVIAPLPNMAELIRTNGKTNIFSHMLDRFSFPYYNAAVTKAYQTLHPEFKDSIFTKKYVTEIGAGHRAVRTTPDGNTFKDDEGDFFLKYDPGWNEYYDEKDTRADMAAMFVPSDDVLFDYFSKGKGGWQLVKTYSRNPEEIVEKGDFEALYRKIDDIPLSTLKELINVLMIRSFTDYVPSKITAVMDDAQEQLFDQSDVENIDTCLLANNGVIYIMKEVYGPADYTSVAAPANISKTNLIMKWAINNGKTESDDFMRLNYFAYLKAMKSRFTFFLPSDEALQRYFDPVSFTNRYPRVIALQYVKKNGFPLKYTLYSYDPATATESDRALSAQTATEDELVNRLKDVLESHTIVHDGSNPIDSEDEYYLTKNGSAIKVTRDATGTITSVQGGYQLENERHGRLEGSRGTVSIAVTAENTSEAKNGRTYVIDDAPIIPPSQSVYGVLSEDTTNAPFSKFLDMTRDDESIILACGLVPSNAKAETRTRLLSKYHVWAGPNDQTGNGGGIDNNVQFFNNYRYTVFVPTNEAIEAAVAKGLPTWETIEEDYHSLPHPLVDSLFKGKPVLDENGDTIRVYDMNAYILTREDSLRLQAKITYLNNFIRGHFLDNSVFADKTAWDEPADFVTSSYNNDLGIFVKVHVMRNGQDQLQVWDDNGGAPLNVTELKNIMARDVVCTLNNKNTSPTYARNGMNNIKIQGSSFAVIHQIPGVLNHMPLNADGTYGVKWDDANACKAYLQKFSIPETATMNRIKARLWKR
ncbi:MAG: hypothetical protein J6W75_00115 [Bacteroidaceae bacterium]|nr:hypothetical protein [Bacteroidaceae bacterium]